MKTSGIDRREFMQTGVALSAATVATGAFAAAETPLMLERFVVDRRFPDAVDAGRAARRQGVAVAEVDGDLSRLWYEDLDLAWRRRPMTLAGVTGAEGLFVLETLAADRGMRVAYRGEHAGGAAACHRLRGPAAVVAALAGRLSAGRAGGDDVFRVLAAFPARSEGVETISIGAAAGSPFDPHEGFVSWVIAPRGTATTVPAV